MASAVQVVLNPHRRSPQAMALLDALQARVVGQGPALERIVDTYQTLLAGLNSRQRPLANFLFLGPTGSGKTHVVESLAEELFHNSHALIKVDCAEFQHSHEIAKLVGSPPGYLGHRETHPILTQEALDQYQTPDLPLNLVLFDEIEKASDALWQLLLGILDKASLTLGDNRHVSFARSMIFLTSNLGAGEMQGLLRPGFGFAPGMAANEIDANLQLRLDQTAVAAAQRKFSPEFFNRLDHVVVFRPLDRAQLERVLDLELNAVRLRLADSFRPPAKAGAIPPPERSVEFRCTDAARAYLLSEGADLKFGARHLKRAIERLLVAPLASLIATHQVGGAERGDRFSDRGERMERIDRVVVDWQAGSTALMFSRESAAYVRGAAVRSAS
ncbi:MAG TPA: AAA family ATPase [Terriglobales bacterium]|nr:AAA family ATPase [Terriglobales bacterium]